MSEQTKGLITQEPLLTPSEVVENATTQAKHLMDIVDKTKCFQVIKGKKYLQVEAWETIGAFNRCHAETKEIKPVHEDGNIVGYEAHVQLLQDGIVVGGAIMPCYLTENCCKGKQGDEKHKACMSAAQTFAESKAFRMNYSYVAILAGYQPMPAEEITKDMSRSGGDGDGGKKQSQESLSAIDMTWLKESLDSLMWVDVGKWLKEHYLESKGQTVKAMVESLSWEHQEQFKAEVQKRLSEQEK